MPKALLASLPLIRVLSLLGIPLSSLAITNLQLANTSRENKPRKCLLTHLWFLSVHDLALSIIVSVGP